MEKYYDNSICTDCERESFCPEPCNAFLDDLDRFNKENKNTEKSNPCKSTVTEGSKANKNKLLCDNECLEDYLTISVEDDAWLEILNGRYTIERVMDYDLVYKFIEEKNKEFCDEHGLCEECRSELVEVNDPKGEFWGTPVSEKILVCPKCG